MARFNVYLGLALVVLAITTGGAHGMTTRGVVALDSYTFDKVVDGTKPVLVKFDKMFPHGEKEEMFKMFAKAMTSTSLIIAEVGVMDHGDKDNYDLLKRFSIKYDQLPVYALFTENHTTDPLMYKGDLVRDTFLQWLEDEVGVWVGLKGRLKMFDAIVHRLNKNMVTAEDALTEARAKAAELKDEAQIKSANIYIQIMEKLKETSGMKQKGFFQQKTDNVRQAANDLKQAITDKVLDAKDSMAEWRANIMSAFRMSSDKEDL